MSTPAPKAKLSLGEKIVNGIGWLFVVLLGLMLLTAVMPCCPVFPRKGHELQVKVVMKDLDLAIKAYQTEYGTEPSLKEFWKDERTPILAEGEILKVLMSQNERLNPRKIAFFEPPTDRGSEKRPGTMKLENGDLRIVDYNGNPFSILIDLDDDRRIPNPDPGAKEDEKLTGKVLIYTAGKDGNPSTWDDNLKSWE